MIVWKEYVKRKYSYGSVKSETTYKWLLLFGIIPIFVSVIKED